MPRPELSSSQQLVFKNYVKNTYGVNQVPQPCTASQSASYLSQTAIDVGAVSKIVYVRLSEVLDLNNIFQGRLKPLFLRADARLLPLSSGSAVYNAVTDGLKELKSINITMEEFKNSLSSLFELKIIDPTPVRYIIIYCFKNHDTWGGHTSNFDLPINGVPRRFTFIGLPKDPIKIGMKKVFLHEFGHALGLTHFPLSFSPSVPKCMLDARNLGNPEKVRASIKLANQLGCSIWWENCEESSIMYCGPHDACLTDKHLLTPGDAIAFQRQYNHMVSLKNPTTATPKKSSSDLITICTDTQQHQCTIDFTNTSVLRQRKLSRALEPVDCQEQPLKIQTKETLAERLNYYQITDGELKAFIYALSTTLAKKLSRNIEFKHISHEKLEIIIDFIVTTIIYSFPIAVIATGVEYCCAKLKEHLKNYPTLVSILTYLKLLAPIIIGTIYHFYLTQQLAGTIKKAAQLSFEMANNMLAGLLGANLIIAGAEFIGANSIKEKRD